MKMIGRWGILNPEQQASVRAEALRRHTRNREAGNARAKISTIPDEEIDVDGYGAELVFCLLFGVLPDTSEKAGPFDCRLATGETVDVKTTRRFTGRLPVPITLHRQPPDLYALMVGTFPRYRFCGFIRSSELLRPERITNLGYGPTYAAKQTELHELEAVLV